MGSYVLRRFLQAIPLLLGVTVVVFAIIHLAPGDPVEFMVGPSATEETLDRMRQYLGFDRPIYEQYLIWLGNVLRGDFGQSYLTNRPVMDMFWERFPATVLLMGSANILSLLIAIPLGVISALKQYTWTDTVVTFLAFVGVAIPGFWFALLLMYVFAVNLHWLPISGMQTIGMDFSIPDVLWHMVMPVSVLTFVYCAYWMRFVRSSMLEVIRQDYVLLARAKGLPERIVLMKYALRNALLPLITIIGLSFPELFTGSIIIEGVFSWPGIGQLILRAAQNRDFTLVMGVVIIFNVAVVAGNLLADVAYSWADPRIKY